MTERIEKDVWHVSCDLEGETTKIICAECDEPTGTCRLKTSVSRGGMLSRLLERVSEGTLDTKNTRCVVC